jgi:phosphoribosylformylglycinamidine synthase
MKFGIITFPGSNCDDDMMYVLGDVFGHKVTKIWHKETSLKGINPGDCIVLPGGFSYGDYLRCGAIARFSPIMEAVIRFANEGGMVLGICNGFQILCEAGLLPGQLLLNKEQLFICDNIFIKPHNSETALTYHLDVNKAYSIPIAHAEGRYYADPLTLHRLDENKQIIFQYCDKHAHLSEHSNVNGSSMNIAGICNEGRNVYGMMPHPERASESALGNTDGRLVFESLFGWMKEHFALIA